MKSPKNTRPQPPPAAQQPSSPLGTGRKIAFAVVAVVLFLAVLEGVLALCGVRPQLYEKDPHVGFSSQTPLFVEETGHSGTVVLRTARNRLEFFNPQWFPKIKAPGAYRIFSMGGSTTYGHPYADSTSFSGWLREYLRATAPGRTWEVINAGGISYGSYRVAQLMEELIRYQPDLFIIYSGHNEFLERRIYGKIRRMPGGLQGLTGLAWRLRSAALVQKALAPLRRLDPGEAAVRTVLARDPVTLLDNTLGPSAYTRDDALRERIFEHYEFNLLRMVDIARSAGARILFVTPVSNLRDVSPFKSEHRRDLTAEERQRWLELYEQARADFANPVPTNALTALASAEAIDDRVANLHFVRGRVLEKLGRHSEAKAAFARARDEDVCPLRGPTRIREILRRVTAQRKVPWVDFEAWVESKSEHGLPGASLFLDHVHLTVEGYRMLALELLKSLESEGVVQPNWDPARMQQTTEAVLSRIDPKAHAYALMNLCKTIGWAGKREEAYRAGIRAVELTPDDPEIRYQAGLAAQLSGRTNEAFGHYRQAVRLRPAFGEAHCALGVLLEDTGQLAEALVEYRLAAQHGKPRDKERDARNLARVQAKVAAE